MKPSIVSAFSLGPDLLRPATKDFARRLPSEDFAVRTAAIVDFLKACLATSPPQSDLDRMLVFNGMVPRAVQLGVPKIPDGGYDKVIARFQGPILVTFGLKDLRLSPEMANRVLAVIHGAKLSTYPKDGHSPFFESPKRFARELAAFARLATDATGSVP
jgi:non-heme chloroperoxidase